MVFLELILLNIKSAALKLKRMKPHPRYPSTVIFFILGISLLIGCQTISSQPVIGTLPSILKESTSTPSLNLTQKILGAPSSLNGNIAYQSGIGNNINIYILALSAGLPKQLTYTNGDMEPSWSPDGQQIAFACNQGNHHEICTMNSDGSNITRLTNSSADKWGPAWSPDGRQIAFVSNAPSYAHIYIIDINTKQIRRFLPEAQGNESAPAYSPDGNWIAYMSDRDGFNIYKAHPDGSGEVQLTNSRLDDRPRWSPDGKTIVFRRLAKNSSFFNGNEIYRMDSDGKNVKALTDNSVGDDWPSFSPDGKWIIFSEEVNSQYNLMVMPVSGGKPMLIGKNGIPGNSASWKQ